MKHLLRGLWIVALILCCNFQQVFAQQMPPIPVDKNVRIGKLDNGLTYYIRKNSQPANRADFYNCPKGRLHSGRSRPARPCPLPGTHVFQWNDPLPR